MYGNHISTNNKVKEFGYVKIAHNGNLFNSSFSA